MAKPGEVEGRLEAVVDGRAIGWAWDPERPDQAIEVEVLVDGEPVARSVADVERPTLAGAGVGTGRYGFDVQLPQGLSATPSHKIEVTAGSDGDAVPPASAFETTVRSPGAIWRGTTFVPAGAEAPRPFVPEEEPPPDPGEAALVGRRDWLFLRDDANLTPEELAGAPLLPPEEIPGRVETLGRRHRRLRELRIPYLFAVAPLKERICAEFLPEGLSLHPDSPVPRLDAELRDANAGEILDLGPPLERGGGQPLFWRTGSGWSDRGAFLAYRELMREAGKRVVDLGDPLPPQETAFAPQRGLRGDLADKPKFAFLGDELVAAEDRREWREEIEVADVSGLRALRMPAPEHLEVVPGRAPRLYEVAAEPELPRAVLVGDACCLPLIQWLAEHFRRFVFLWSVELPLEAIELEMPDVVIHVVSERFLVRGR